MSVATEKDREISHGYYSDCFNCGPVCGRVRNAAAAACRDRRVDRRRRWRTGRAGCGRKYRQYARWRRRRCNTWRCRGNRDGPEAEQQLLSVPTFGWLGLHGSLLGRFQGRREPISPWRRGQVPPLSNACTEISVSDQGDGRRAAIRLHFRVHTVLLPLIIAVNSIAGSQIMAEIAGKGQAPPAMG